MSSSYEANGYMPNNHDVLQQHRSDFDAFQTNTITTTAKPKRKRESTLRKAPGAPKRFKSSYILFFMAQRDGIKRELGPKASVSSNRFFGNLELESPNTQHRASCYDV